jgi:hypothetical protein
VRAFYVQGIEQRQRVIRQQLQRVGARRRVAAAVAARIEAKHGVTIAQHLELLVPGFTPVHRTV